MSVTSDNNDKETKPKGSTVIFAPVCGTLEDYQDLFKEFSYLEIAIKQACGLLRLTSTASAELFCRRFNGYKFRGTSLKCEIARVLPMPGDKTIKLAGIEGSDITERDVYDAMRQFGFLRRVFVKGDCAYVDFDTTDEAKRFTEAHKSIEIGNTTLKAERISCKEAQSFSTFPIPLSELIPCDHPIWHKLNELLQGM